MPRPDPGQASVLRGQGHSVLLQWNTSTSHHGDTEARRTAEYGWRIGNGTGSTVVVVPRGSDLHRTPRGPHTSHEPARRDEVQAFLT